MDMSDVNRYGASPSPIPSGNVTDFLGSDVPFWSGKAEGCVLIGWKKQTGGNLQLSTLVRCAGPETSEFSIGLE